VNGVVMDRQEGTPQGGPLSPLLANVLLDEDLNSPKRRTRTRLSVLWQVSPAQSGAPMPIQLLAGSKKGWPRLQDPHGSVQRHGGHILVLPRAACSEP